MSGFASLTAIVLAGGGRDEVCRDDPEAVNKAFVSLNGVPLVMYALRALREASLVQTILVTAPPSAPDDALKLADGRRESGPKLSDSLESGMRDLDPDQLVLICTSDLPVLTPMAVDDFVERAQRSGCDIGYGFLGQAAHDEHYPDIRHTWARFREGVFCGTGLCVLRPRALPGLMAILQRAAEARKQPWRLASLLGAKILTRYALGILSIEEVEERASALLGHRARGIISRYPESAINIDRYHDLQYFRKRGAP
jgi:molybdopterin-guanine dinucleotide biosynthesis protein A